MAANSTARCCRKLFQDSAPRAAVQDTMKNLMRLEAERLATKWNFDVTRASSYVPTPEPTPTSHPNLQWQLFQPKASFYARSPRRLKARRRLNPSLAQKLCRELYGPRKTLSDMNFSGILGPDFKFGSPQSEGEVAQRLAPGETPGSTADHLTDPLPVASSSSGVGNDREHACPCSSFAEPTSIFGDFFQCHQHNPISETIFGSKPSTTLNAGGEQVNTGKRKSETRVTGEH
ncbi:unnamed protein product [Schistocephalus solidus]|uniref:Cyclin-dependent kinase inhibitor domain-containing protein n=1 Tax=Schistocephalus solidus TaxID=70667 RepID=A0A183T7T5_SCHSO|nr:unnamed protein product [Schistocephalus solidus]